MSLLIERGDRMKYHFDEIIDRKNARYSYSMKHSESPMIADMIGVNKFSDETIPLFTADMDFKTAQPIIDALKGVADHGVFGYSLIPKEYYDAVISWFKRHHQWQINEDDIVYVDGTIEAMNYAIKSFTDEGDGVIIQRPVYGPFTSSVENAKRIVVNNQLIKDDEGYYTMDFEDLEAKAKDPQNKLLLLCNPHNPVGRVWKPEELKELSRICKENDVIIFADEIHGDLTRKDVVFTPIATVYDDDHVITATAVNKTFNLAGLHCTNLVIPNLQLRNQFVNTFGLTLPSPFTIAAVVAAYNDGEEWLEQLKEYLDHNIDWVLTFLKKKMPQVKVSLPEGTYIIWIDFSAYGLSAQEIHHRIYDKADVLLEGGNIFDPDLGDGFERVCVPSARSVIEEAFNRIYEQFKDLEETAQ